jgi:hypothetical protein
LGDKRNRGCASGDSGVRYLKPYVNYAVFADANGGREPVAMTQASPQ